MTTERRTFLEAHLPGKRVRLVNYSLTGLNKLVDERTDDEGVVVRTYRAFTAEELREMRTQAAMREVFG
jgi:hypothetical protein